MHKRVRAQKIVIDLPTEGILPWVQIVAQDVYKDDTDNVLQTVEISGNIHRSLPDFANNVKTITDPVTNSQLSCSGAGLAEIIKAFATCWMQEAYGGEINESGELIKDA